MPRLPRPRAPMTSLGPLLLALCSVLLGSCVSFPIHNASLLVGKRFYDKTTFEPIDTQTTVGLEFDTYKLTNGLGFEIGGFWSWDEEGVQLESLGPAQVDSENYELYLGVRKTFLFRDEPFYPYIGGGLTGMHTKLGLDTIDGLVEDSDTTGGIYVHAGVYWNFIGNANIGLDLRRVFATSVDLFDVDTDIDYTQAMVILGFSF